VQVIPYNLESTYINLINPNFITYSRSTYFTDPSDIVKELGVASRIAHKFDNKVLPALRESLASSLDEENPSFRPESQVIRIPRVFAERELRTIAAKMWKVRNHWTHRLELMPFFTLGRSSHHDGEVAEVQLLREGAKGKKLVSKNNIPIEDQFGIVHQRVLEVR
jgi:hypothetical protein